MYEKENEYILAVNRIQHKTLISNEGFLQLITKVSSNKE
jgi:hypothetical protein